jgi:hypothetical protein
VTVPDQKVDESKGRARFEPPIQQIGQYFPHTEQLESLHFAIVLIYARFRGAIIPQA